jgi:integrase
VWQAQIIRQGFKPQFRTFNTKGESEAWARRVESEMDAGAWLDRSEGDRTTLGDALGRYLVEITPGKAPATVVNERARILRLQDTALARYALSRLTGRDVADYIRERLRTVKPASVVSELAIVSHVYTVAMSAWGMAYLVNPVPLARTALPPTAPGRNRRLEDGEQQQLLDVASPIIAKVIRFALATAMRRSEIAGLRWDQVNTKLRTALLPKTKNGEARSVPLSPDALKVLEDLSKPFDKRQSVFGLDVEGISSGWKRARTAAGIRGLRFHDLRHEAISRLFEETDLDSMEIMAITGHKTPQMLARYTHLRAHRLADRLAGVARGASR